jgi:hypothetical protein
MHRHFAAPAARMGRWLGLGCTLLVLAACAPTNKSLGDYDILGLSDNDEDKVVVPEADWAALKDHLPPVPDAAHVLPIEPLKAVDHFTFGIDPRSIQIAPGDVVRYTVRSVSDMGAENISYETVRCGERQWRTIAQYRPGVGWERSAHEDWRTYQLGSLQSVLHSSVFCSGGGPAGSKPEHLVNRLKHWKDYTDGLSMEDRKY